MADKAKSNETSTGHHPFIINPKKWVGTPWDKGDHFGSHAAAHAENAQSKAQSNAELVAKFHERLAASENVSDLFGETARNRSLAASGRAPVFPGAKKKKLSTVSQPTPSAQDKAAAGPPEDPNPFTEALLAKRLPIEVRRELAQASTFCGFFCPAFHIALLLCLLPVHVLFLCLDISRSGGGSFGVDIPGRVQRAAS